MSDLDAVRKAYDDAYGIQLGVRTKLAHDAGLAAVVEWAMNRAAEEAEAIRGITLERTPTAKRKFVALLKDGLTERKN